MSAVESQPIIINYHPQSLERFENNGHILKKIGVGRMASPGRPGGNQQYYSQLEFVRTLKVQRLFPVFYNMGHKIEYMGEYALETFTKRQSFEGFTYFIYTMHRKKKPVI